MDFFANQEHARRATKWLVAYFAAGVVGLVLAVYVAVSLVFFGISNTDHHHRSFNYYYNDRPLPQVVAWNPGLFGGVAVCTLAVIGIGSLVKTMELARGGSAVATMLGGRTVSPTTTDPDERKLLNVVEEMAIASGVPVPQVYLLPDEPGINAFAAGHSNSDAVVAVTRGSMRLLTRDELQGVIAHEFSHMLNGDMRLNLRLMGVVFGIVCLTVIGRILLQTRGRKNPLPLLGLALLLIGWIGVLFGRLIQAAVSRQREFLADASAVQFTRNPDGLAGALKKIGGLSYGSKLKSANAEQACHMFFGNGMGESFLHLMDSHPPLTVRIRALDPSFDGVFPLVIPARAEPAPPAAPRPARRPPLPFPFPAMPQVQAGTVGIAAPPVLDLPQGQQVAGSGGGFPGRPGIGARVVLANAGNPAPRHLRYADELRNAFPPSLQTAARETLGATTIVFALLLSDDETVRRKQLDELAAVTSTATRQETLRILPDVQSVATHAKLPLVDLVMPALRDMSPLQYKVFQDAVQKLVESDGEIDLFEYVLQKIVLRHLDPHFNGPRKTVVQYYALKPLAGDCAVLLSALAYIGQQEPAAVQAAFDQGAAPLSNVAQVELPLVPSAQCELEHVDAALNRLALAVPQIKKNVLNACAQTVAADGVIQELEAELLRAIADALDCPLPPFI